MQLTLFPEPSTRRRTLLFLLHLVIATRSMRDRENLRLQPYKLLILAVIVLLLLVDLMLFFGADEVLPLLADSVPLLIAVIGIIMSYRQPSKESHLVTTIVLVLAGVVGSAILTAVRTRNENAHKVEVKELQHKIDSVGDINGKILAAVVNPPKAPELKTDEATRRQRVIQLLRNDYVLHHQRVSAGLLAGTEPERVRRS